MFFRWISAPSLWNLIGPLLLRGVSMGGTEFRQQGGAEQNANSAKGWRGVGFHHDVYWFGRLGVADGVGGPTAGIVLREEIGFISALFSLQAVRFVPFPPPSAI